MLNKRSKSHKKWQNVRRRRMVAEQLERRDLLAVDSAIPVWQNPMRPLDTNNDTYVTPIDALLVINQLNMQNEGAGAPLRENFLAPFLDTNGDRFFSPIDALLVINELNSKQGDEPTYPIARKPGGQAAGPAGFVSDVVVQIPGEPGELYEVTVEWDSARHPFHEMGLLVTDDGAGEIKGVSPHSEPYPFVAFDLPEKQVLFSHHGLERTTATAIFGGGQWIAAYFLQRASAAERPSEHIRTERTGPDTFRIGWQELTARTADAVSSYDDSVLSASIRPINLNPEIVSEPSKVISDDSNFVYQVVAEDDPGEHLTYELLSSPTAASIDPVSGLVTLDADHTSIGRYYFALQVKDDRGGYHRQKFNLSVVESLPNRPPVILSEPRQDVEVNAEAVRYATQTMQVEDWTASDFSEPESTWELNRNGQEVTQSTTDAPTMLLSNVVLSNHRWEGTAQSNYYFGGGFFGLVFGYQNEQEFYLFDWKQKDSPDDHWGSALEGMSVKRFHSSTPLTAADLWKSEVEADKGETHFRNTLGWDRRPYQLTLEQSPGKVTIVVRSEGELLETIALDLPDLQGGRVGFYTNEQSPTTFRNFQSKLLGGDQYEYQVEAQDADGDLLKYTLVEAPRDMRIDSRSGRITWQPTFQDVGDHHVAVKVSDNAGGEALQQFVLCVHPAASNAAPQIISQPITDHVYFDQDSREYINYRYQVTAIDSDSEDLFYSLIDPPEGMNINSSTGLLEWPGRDVYNWPDEYGFHEAPRGWAAGAGGTSQVEIMVSDAEGGIDVQTFELFTYDEAAGFVSGYVYEDLNGNGLLDTNFVVGDAPYLVFAIDNSCSMDDPFVGERVGDLNGDDRFDTRFDAALLGIKVLLNRIAADPRLADTKISFVDFFGRPTDMNPVLDGKQYFIGIADDADGNGIRDFEDLFQVLRTGCGGTNYERALENAIEALNAETVATDSRNVLFMTDGVPERSGPWEDDVATLHNMGVNLQGLGIGRGTLTTQLQAVDSDAHEVSHTQDLLNTFQGFDITGFEAAEPVLSGWTVYLDKNSNAQLDVDEVSTTSDSAGYYEFSDLAIGKVHRVRTVVPEGWSQSTPHRGNYSTVLWAGLPESTFNFGNIQHSLEIGSQAPAFVTSPPTKIVSNETLRYDAIVSDPESEQVTYQLVLGPNNASVHPTEGVLMWKPGNHDLGAHNFIVRAVDAQGKSTNQSFRVLVEPPNTAPFVSSVAPQVWPTHKEATYRLRTLDAEQDLISYRLLDAPANMQLSSSGEVKWTPDDSPEGLMIADGAIGYWRFNEPADATIALDASGNGLDAIVPEDTQRTHGRSAADGDSALEFDNWRAKVVHQGTAEIQADQFSIEGWIKPSADGLGWILDRHFDQSSYGSGLSYSGSSIRFSVNRTGVSYELELDTWSHVAGSFNGDEIALYVNGSLVRQRSFQRPFRRSENDFVTGGFQIAVDDVAFFDYVLTPEQVRSHFEDSIQHPRIVEVEVADEHGASSVHSFEIYTSADHENQPPGFRSIMPSRALVGTPLTYLVQAFDDTGDNLQFGLQQAPAGMVIDSQGVLTWTPTSDQIGVHSIAIEVVDSEGAISTQTGEIVVGTQLQNTGPRIDSLAPRSSVVESVFTYDPHALDAEGDPLLWTLLEAPTGASIDALTGQIRWRPSHEQLGDNAFLLVVQDAFGLQDEQRFSVSVACFNAQPQIVSVPSTRTRIDETYVYAVHAVDAESDPLAWELLESPTGMHVDSHGTISWRPTAGQFGLHQVQIKVSDGTSTQTQSYNIEVLDPLEENRAPVVSSEPIYQARTSSPYTYQFLATDPDGDAVAFSTGDSLPAGMQLAASGVLTWTPTLSQAGLHTVSLVATDVHGLAAAQVYELLVEENLPPQITSLPATSIEAGTEYQHLLKAYDPEGGTIRFQLEEAPEGMQMDALGRISWVTSAGEASPVPVSVSATDEFGLQTSKSWQIELISDTEPPVAQVSIISGTRNLTEDATLDVGSVFQVRVSGRDNVGIASYQLSVDGKLVGLDEQGFATVRVDRVADIALVGTVTDRSGHSDNDTLIVRVEDPATRNTPIPTDSSLPPNPGQDPTDTGVPTIEITSPEAANSVSNLVPIIGTVDDPEDNLWFYRVYFARADRVDLTELDLEDSDWQLLNESTKEVHDGELAVFDSTLVMNDAYAIAVAAYDANGLGYIQPTMVYVEGNVDIGNFSVRVTDLQIPLAGIPIQVSRTYDTRNALDEGDFGFGWTLSIANPRIFEAAAVGAGGAFTPGNDKFVPNKTKVYLTNPIGQRVGFTYREKLHRAGLFGGIFTPFFDPDPGVYDQLTIDETQVARGSIAGNLAQGINPDFYTLTTKEGLEYRYEDRVGLKTIKDRVGNVVTVTATSLEHSSGQSIQMTRDDSGRIETVTDPAGNAINYEYSDGELRKVTDQVGLETQYTYRTDWPHYLDGAFNSLGRRVLTVHYDANGKFARLTDALGNDASQDFDTTANTGIVRDVLGNETILYYDDRGNVLREVDPVGNETVRVYSDPDNPDLETRIVDRRGFIDDRAYDDRGNLLSMVAGGTQADPLAVPIKSTFAYDSDNNLQAITNAKGDSTRFEYDENGLLKTVTNAHDAVSKYTYDDQGRRKTFTDFNGNVTRFEYNDSCPCGSPSRVTFADGTYQTFLYNDLSQVTEEAHYEQDGTLVELRQTDFDKNGRVVEERYGIDGDPEHPQTIVRKFYRGHLLDWEVVVHPDSLDENGNLLETPDTPIDQRRSRITSYEYDDADRLIRQTNAEGGVVEFRYNAAGNRILLQDPVGNITTWVYDLLQRVSEERDPFYNEGLSIDQAITELADPSGADLSADLGAPHVRAFGYDAEGNQLEMIDRNGRRREFNYDYAGRLLEERWYAAGSGDLVETTSFTFDVLGNMLTSSDSNSKYAYTYDALNRLQSVDNNPDDSHPSPRVILNYGYDAQGNLIRTRDDAGVSVDSRYDTRNRLSVRTWYDADVASGGTADVDPVRVEFDYNAAGRQSEVRRYSGLDTSNLIGRTLRTYDAAGRSNLLDHLNATDELLAGYDYGYDFGGLVTHESRSHQDSDNAQEITYGYDLTGQLVDAWFSGQDNEHFEYDPNGNRITSTLGSEQRSYTTDTANQLSSDGIHRYEYDGEGNQIKRVHLTTGETRTMQYDHHNRLVRVDDWSSDPGHPNDPDSGSILLQTVEYTYDAHGRRIARTVDEDGAGPETSRREFYVYNGDNVWADVDVSGATNARYLFGNTIDSNIAKAGLSGGVIWTFSDQLGTQRDSLDGTGIQHFDYRTFGGLESFNQIPMERYLFTGREYDAALQSYFYRARQFSPVLGSFAQQDPLSFSALDMNLYRYVANSVVNVSDPTGTTFFEDLVATTYIGGIIVGTAATVNCGIELSASDLSTEDQVVNTLFAGVVNILVLPWIAAALVAAGAQGYGAAAFSGGSAIGVTFEFTDTCPQRKLFEDYFEQVLPNVTIA